MDVQDRRYKIMSESTTGWTLMDPEAQNLTKEDCDKRIADLLKGGANPNYFKVVANNDPKYIDAKTGLSL